MSFFQWGEFQLNSGASSPFKIDCDALSPADWAALAQVLLPRLPAFGAVEGVPRGGLALAECLRPYATEGPLLIVDDVLTTGGSMERHRAGRAAVGVVVFARGETLPWVTPLFRM